MQVPLSGAYQQGLGLAGARWKGPGGPPRADASWSRCRSSWEDCWLAVDPSPAPTRRPEGVVRRASAGWSWPSSLAVGRRALPGLPATVAGRGAPTSSTSPPVRSGWVAWSGWRSACRRSRAGHAPRRRPRLASPASRPACWSLLVASGSVLAWRIVGSWDDLFGDDVRPSADRQGDDRRAGCRRSRPGTGSRCCLACIGAADRPERRDAASAIRRTVAAEALRAGRRPARDRVPGQPAATPGASRWSTPTRTGVVTGTLGEDLAVLGTLSPGSRGHEHRHDPAPGPHRRAGRAGAATRPCGCGRTTVDLGDLALTSSDAGTFRAEVRASHRRDLAGPGEPAARRVREPGRRRSASAVPAGWTVTVTGTVCRKPSTRTCTNSR